MIRPTNIIVSVIAAGLLAGMLLTNPDYNRAVSPFITHVASGQNGATRLVSGRFEGWRTADRIEFSDLGKPVIRDTQGVFLMADLRLSGQMTSALMSATWVGASKRRYETTRRVQGLPRQIDQQFLQPGLESRTLAVFELPPDEIAGGSLLLSAPYDPPLEGSLMLAPPATPPEHEAIARFTE